MPRAEEFSTVVVPVRTDRVSCPVPLRLTVATGPVPPGAVSRQVCAVAAPASKRGATSVAATSTTPRPIDPARLPTAMCPPSPGAHDDRQPAILTLANDPALGIGVRPLTTLL